MAATKTKKEISPRKWFIKIFSPAFSLEFFLIFPVIFIFCLAISAVSARAGTPHYFLMSKDIHNCDFSVFGADDAEYKGFSGANKWCLDQVNKNDWKGKQTGHTYQQSEVKAWLCAAKACQNLLPNTQYAFGQIGTSYGGATFTTDSQGRGPGPSLAQQPWSVYDMKDFNSKNVASYMGYDEVSEIFTGRSAGDDNWWSASAVGKNPATGEEEVENSCYSWAMKGNNGLVTMGETSFTGTKIWSGWDYWDAAWGKLVCAVGEGENINEPKPTGYSEPLPHKFSNPDYMTTNNDSYFGSGEKHYSCLPAPEQEIPSSGGVIYHEQKFTKSGGITVRANPNKRSQYSPHGLEIVGSPEFEPKNTPAYCSDGDQSGIYWNGEKIDEVFVYLNTTVDYFTDHTDWRDAYSIPGRVWKNQFAVGKQVVFGGQFPWIDGRLSITAPGLNINYDSSDVWGSMKYDMPALYQYIDITVRPANLDVPFHTYMSLQWGNGQDANYHVDEDGDTVFTSYTTENGRKIQWDYKFFGENGTLFNLKRATYSYVNKPDKKEFVYLYDYIPGFTWGNTYSFLKGKHYLESGSMDYYLVRDYDPGLSYLKVLGDIFYNVSGSEEYKWFYRTYFDNNETKQDRYYDKNGGYVYYEISYVKTGNQATKGYKPDVAHFLDSEGNITAVLKFDQFSDPNNDMTYRSRMYRTLFGQEILELTQYFVNNAEDASKRIQNLNAQAEEGKIRLEKEFGFNLSTMQYEPTVLSLIDKIIKPYHNNIKNLDDQQKIFAKYADAAIKFETCIRGLEWVLHGKKIDERPGFNGAVAWMGQDMENNDFFGVWILPGANGPQTSITDGAFLDLTTADSTKNVLAANSFSALKALPKRLDKWDNYLPMINSNGMAKGSDSKAYNNNVFTNQLKGGYMPVTEFFKPDPTTNKFLDGFLEYEIANGDDLETMSNKDVTEKFFSYFMAQPFSNYMWDWVDSMQTVGETVARQGGDCEDFAVVGANLLHNLFLRLGKISAADNVYLAMVKITSKADQPMHVVVLFKDPSNGKFYYLETALIIKGKSYPIADAMIALSGWNVHVPAAQWDAAIQYYTRSDGSINQIVNTSFTSLNDGLAKTPTKSVGSNRGAMISQANGKFINPFSLRVEIVTGEILAALKTKLGGNEEWKNLSIPEVLGFTNYVLSKITQNEKDSGFDYWKTPDETLNGIENTKEFAFQIKGDCEDLAFVEASVMQNILIKYNYLNSSDITKDLDKAAFSEAKKQVAGTIVVLGEANHMEVAYVSDLDYAANPDIYVMNLDEGYFTKAKLKDYEDQQKVRLLINHNRVASYFLDNWSAYQVSSNISDSTYVITPIDYYSSIYGRFGGDVADYNSARANTEILPNEVVFNSQLDQQETETAISEYAADQGISRTYAMFQAMVDKYFEENGDARPQQALAEMRALGVNPDYFGTLRLDPKEFLALWPDGSVELRYEIDLTGGYDLLVADYSRFVTPAVQSFSDDELPCYDIDDPPNGSGLVCPQDENGQCKTPPNNGDICPTDTSPNALSDEELCVAFNPADPPSKNIKLDGDIWTWTCSAKGNGIPMPCQASKNTKKSGECGSAINENFCGKYDLSASDIPNLCKGNVTAEKFANEYSKYTWDCQGTCGGSSASCSAPGPHCGWIETNP